MQPRNFSFWAKLSTVLGLEITIILTYVSPVSNSAGQIQLQVKIQKFKHLYVS